MADARPKRFNERVIDDFRAPRKIPVVVLERT
jgi:hypothetical protein